MHFGDRKSRAAASARSRPVQRAWTFHCNGPYILNQRCSPFIWKTGRVQVQAASPGRARREGFALIRLLCGGICNTDLELQRGYYGFSGTPGHEFVGEVVEADDRRADRTARGRRDQPDLRQLRLVPPGLGRHCPKRTVLGIVKHPGAFREFLTLPERNLHVVPDSIPTEHAVFIEPLAAACEILDQVQDSLQLASGRAGRWQARAADRAGAQRPRLSRPSVRPASRRNCASPRAPASRPKSYASASPRPRTTGWWTRPVRPKDCGHAVRMTRPRGTVIMKSTLHGLVGDRHRAGHRQRDHAGRLALRALRAGARSAEEPVPSMWPT